MWPGFNSRAWRRMCYKAFSPGSLDFLPPQKTNTSKFQFDQESEGHRFVSRKTVYVLLDLLKGDFIFLFRFISVLTMLVLD